MGSFEKNLFKAIKMCNGKFIDCHEFSQIYTFTTENISGYLKYFDLQNKSLLTVGSSGDQILNAYFKGARDITLYDINELAKYYVYLKIAAILSLDYQEFQIFFLKRNTQNKYNQDVFSKYLFNKIKPTLKILDFESFIFFDELFHIYTPERIRQYLFDDDAYLNKAIKNFNIYLRNEITYNKLKSIIKTISFKYINGNIFDDDINGKFDNIFLSNLCTTTDIENLKQLLTKLDNNNPNPNGSILLGYLWDIDFDSNNYHEEWIKMYKIPITREKLKKYITEYYNIKGTHDFVFDKTTKSDLVLIYRKK